MWYNIISCVNEIRYLFCDYKFNVVGCILYGYIKYCGFKRTGFHFHVGIDC